MYFWRLDVWQSWQWKSVRKYGTLGLNLNIPKGVCIYFHIILDNQFQLDYSTKFKWKHGNNWSGDNFHSPWLGLTCNLWHWTVIFPRSAEPDLSPDRKRILSLITDLGSQHCAEIKTKSVYHSLTKHIWKTMQRSMQAPLTRATSTC